MRFLAYGPFRYDEQTNEETKRLFERIDGATAQLQHSFGVYVFAAKDSDAHLIPWYVGKAVKHDMGARIFSHLDNGKFVDLISQAKGISVILIAAADEDGQLKERGSLSESDAKRIGDLEMSCIGSAYLQNSELLNIQGKQSAKHVPIAGDIISGGSGNSAAVLAELLGFEQA